MRLLRFLNDFRINIDVDMRLFFYHSCIRHLSVQEKKGGKGGYGPLGKRGKVKGVRGGGIGGRVTKKPKNMVIKDLLGVEPRTFR